MAEITWTAEAQRWLEDIFGYIAADNPHAAAQTVNGIYELTQKLANFPEWSKRKLRLISAGDESSRLLKKFLQAFASSVERSTFSPLFTRQWRSLLHRAQSQPLA